MIMYIIFDLIVRNDKINSVKVNLIYHLSAFKEAIVF